MIPGKFQEIVASMLNHCNNTLVVKAKEYSRNNDSLHNFNQGVKSSTTGESREEIIWGMARKHWLSIIDIREDVKKDKLPAQELLSEKFGDMINYLLIEYASITEKIEENSNIELLKESLREVESKGRRR